MRAASSTWALSTDTVTAGFRIYSGSKAQGIDAGADCGASRGADPKWVAQQKKRLGRKVRKLLVRHEKGEWTKHEGWPTDPENWKKIQAWIVRKKMKPAAATRAAFPGIGEGISRSLSAAEIHQLARLTTN